MVAKMDFVGGMLEAVLVLGLIVSASSTAPYHDPHCGGKQAIVHLFEWKWTDIARECVDYLGPMGFCGVQVSPPNEHAVVTTDAMRPWWERYQPVSYKVVSRSGNEAQFKDMVATCKSVGVRIYADAVVNHMAGLGRKGPGIGGSSFDSSAFDFPGVPFSKSNFNDRSKCPSGNGGINNYGDPNEVRNCFLSGLTDLDGSQSYVQDKIAAYFNHLIDLGVAGFRIDAAKHMWPNDIKAIQAKTKDLPEGGRPFFIMEVIDRNDGAVKVNEYFDTGYVTEFRYCQKVKEGANDLWRLNQVFDPGWGMAPSDQALVFVDNHDSQRSNGQVLTFKQPDAYKRAMAFTLAYNYGFARVMSSYFYSQYDAGPPHNADYSTKDVTITPSGGCGNGWVCEHRWNPIGRMVKFRNAVVGESVDNWSYNNGVVSFNRGNKGFFSMSTSDFNIRVNTGLPAGEYCDLISACARKILVDSQGDADVSPADGAEPFVAIITKSGQAVSNAPSANPQPAVTSGNPAVAMTTALPPDPGAVSGPGMGTWRPTNETDYRRTVILVERQTNPGQDLFIKGGIDHSHRAGCTKGVTPSPCSIPISHINPGSDPHFDKVNAWSQGDQFLDWNGAEPGQGLYQGQTASGTPAYWSTSDPSHPGYNTLNKFGPHYWMVEVNMDCSKTASGFFEFKAFVNGQWEGDVTSGGSKCTGDSPGTPPYITKNHMARCGYLNVFHYNNPRCTIDELGPAR